MVQVFFMLLWMFRVNLSCGPVEMSVLRLPLSVSVHHVQKPDADPEPGQSGIRLLPGVSLVGDISHF